MIFGTQNCVSEWSYESTRLYRDPFAEVDLDVVVTGPAGAQQIIPTFWSGERTWRVRYAPPEPGSYTYPTVCSDAANPDLHGREGTLIAKPYEGENPLLRHGPLRVAADRRHFEHRDGTPFFWLADTWWMWLCARAAWPEDFQILTADRVAKGFTVIQIVAGLYPDQQPYDPRGANEAGFPWAPGFSRINPDYFDMVDLRIGHLVRSGLVPCIVGFWGFYLDIVDVAVLKRHWRYLIARYGAYPVVWCGCGEALMELYFATESFRDPTEPPSDRRAIWSDMLRTIRAADPSHHPITIHPTRYCHEQVDDASTLDFYMLQTGHMGYLSQATTVDMLEDTLALAPKLPVLGGEAAYEGIQESSREEIQRFLFWSCLLSGAAGHTYGANGVWQVNLRDTPYGPGPEGVSWGDTPWEDAYRLPGSAQLGAAKRLLERYRWWEFTAQPDWVQPHADQQRRISAYAGGIPGQVRVVFLPAETVKGSYSLGSKILMKQLEPGCAYHAFYFDPKTAREHEIGAVVADPAGDYALPPAPILQDWVVVIEGGSHEN